LGAGSCALSLLAGCDPRNRTPKSPSFGEQLVRARQKGVEYLIARQAKAGTWHSEVYGVLKDGTGLTPLALNALLVASPESKTAIATAAQYLANLVEKDGTIKAPEYGFDFPLYTSALTVTAFSHPQCPPYPRQRDAWLKYLKERQLTDALGWEPNDREYGGWGYARGIPRKPGPNELVPPHTESNLSATTFALEALHAAGVSPKEATFAKALTFVKRCQNWNDNEQDAEFDDGGFFFIYDDPVRNKAGVKGKDKAGRTRYHSYGSATADGLRCLIYCGVPGSNPRRQAAARWLGEHFDAARHPGEYEKTRELDRPAVYYYYAASFARAPLADDKVDTSEGTLFRKDVLARELVRRQRPDGSWVNPFLLVREDDPIIATCYALLALAGC
jgi:hypothetical protein